jgi:hypothetical protein
MKVTKMSKGVLVELEHREANALLMTLEQALILKDAVDEPDVEIIQEAVNLLQDSN